jgi:hypothetical protein
MQHLDDLKTLIDAASRATGSDYKLAQALEVPRQHVSGWRHGTKTATPEDQALMAGLAGFDPVQTLARATVQKWEGKAKGDRLMKVLGKALPAIGAALGSAGAAAHQIGSMIPSDLLARITQCALC